MLKQMNRMEQLSVYFYIDRQISTDSDVSGEEEELRMAKPLNLFRKHYTISGNHFPEFLLLSSSIPLTCV